MHILGLRNRQFHLGMFSSKHQNTAPYTQQVKNVGNSKASLYSPVMDSFKE
jgi:hypothetical protein